MPLQKVDYGSQALLTVYFLTQFPKLGAGAVFAGLWACNARIYTTLHVFFLRKLTVCSLKRTFLLKPQTIQRDNNLLAGWMWSGSGAIVAPCSAKDQNWWIVGRGKVELGNVVCIRWQRLGLLLLCRRFRVVLRRVLICGKSWLKIVVPFLVSMFTKRSKSQKPPIFVMFLLFFNWLIRILETLVILHVIVIYLNIALQDMSIMI